MEFLKGKSAKCLHFLHSPAVVYTFSPMFCFCSVTQQQKKKKKQQQKEIQYILFYIQKYERNMCCSFFMFVYLNIKDQIQSNLLLGMSNINTNMKTHS